jgi:hypothetical protein
MISGHYDMKRFYRLVLNSRTYQLSSLPQSGAPEATANFAAYPMRRLDAEVLIDAVNKVTGASDLYTSPIPEPFTYIPKTMPAVAIADGSITSPFLALFGRSARATGMENERNNKPTSAQWLHLLNSTDIQRKLEQGPNLQDLFLSSRKQSEILEVLYLTILSRFPTPEEVRIVEAYGSGQGAKRALTPTAKSATTYSVAKESATTNSATTNLTTTKVVTTNSPTGRSGPIGSLGPKAKPSDKTVVVKRREDWLDIAWSLINNEEFLYRH